MQQAPQIKVVAPVNQGQFLATTTPIQPYATATGLVNAINNIPNPNFVTGVARDATFDQVSQTREQPTTNNDSQTVFQCSIPDLVPARNIMLAVPLCFIAKGFVDTITTDNYGTGTAVPTNNIYSSVNNQDWYVDNVNCGAILNIFENSKLFINGVDILNNFCKTKQAFSMIAKSIKGELDMQRVDQLTGHRRFYNYNNLIPYEMQKTTIQYNAESDNRNLFKWLRESTVFNFALTPAATADMLAGTKLEVVHIPLYLIYSFFQQDIILPPGLMLTLELNWPTAGPDFSFIQNKAAENLALTTASYIPICARTRIGGTTANYEDTRPVSYTNLVPGSVAITVCNYHPDLSLYFTCNRPRANLHLEYQLLRRSQPMVYNYQLYSQYEMGIYQTGQSVYKFILTPNQQIPQLLHFAWINKRCIQKLYNQTAWPYSRAVAPFWAENAAITLQAANAGGVTTTFFSYTPLPVPLKYLKISKGGYEETVYAPNQYNDTSFKNGLTAAALVYADQPLLCPNMHLLGTHRLTTTPSERYYAHTDKYEFASRQMNSRPDIDISTTVPISQTNLFNKGHADYITMKLNPATQDIALYPTDLQAYNIGVEVEIDTTDSYFAKSGLTDKETVFVCIREYPAQLVIDASGKVTQYTWPNLLLSNTGPQTTQPANNAPGGL